MGSHVIPVDRVEITITTEGVIQPGIERRHDIAIIEGPRVDVEEGQSPVRDQQIPIEGQSSEADTGIVAGRKGRPGIDHMIGSLNNRLEGSRFIHKFHHGNRADSAIDQTGTRKAPAVDSRGPRAGPAHSTAPHLKVSGVDGGRTRVGVHASQHPFSSVLLCDGGDPSPSVADNRRQRVVSGIGAAQRQGAIDRGGTREAHATRARQVQSPTAGGFNPATSNANTEKAIR